MIQCKHCGLILEEPDAKFCPLCGSPLPVAQAQPTPETPPPPAQPGPSRPVPPVQPPRKDREHRPLRGVGILAGILAALVVGGLLGWVIAGGGQSHTPTAPAAPSSAAAAETPLPTAAPTAAPTPEPSPAATPSPTPTPLPTATPAASPAPTAEPEETVTLPGGGTAPAADFYFPYSSTQTITYDDLEAKFGSLPDEEAYQASQRALNEIYARYGYNFHPEKSDSAAAAYRYFHTLDWYEALCGSNTAASLDQVPVNETEQQNINTIAAWQADRGYR